MVRMALKLGILPPFLWATQSAVNDQVRALADRLTAAGHRVTVIAPTADRLAVDEAQRRVQAVLTGDPRFRAKALQAALAMAGRYDAEVGAMRSRPAGDFNVIVELEERRMHVCAGRPCESTYRVVSLD